MVAFINGEYVPSENASLHVSDLAVQRGYGVFDFLKVVDGHPFFLQEYLNRFCNSAAVMRLVIPLSRRELVQAIFGLIEQNGFSTSGIKMILTGGYSSDGYVPAAPNLIITQHDLVLPDKRTVETGVSIISHEYVRDIPEAKTINYSMGIWLIEKIKAANAYDVLYHSNDKVSEFPRSNFFIVRPDNTIVTPSDNVLKGITRKNVLQLAAKFFKAAEATVTMEDVLSAKEAFITSTTKRILPVVQVNGRTIGSGKPGEVSMALLERLVELEKADQDLSYKEKYSSR